MGEPFILYGIHRIRPAAPPYRMRIADETKICMVTTADAHELSDFLFRANYTLNAAGLLAHVEKAQSEIWTSGGGQKLWPLAFYAVPFTAPNLLTGIGRGVRKECVGVFQDKSRLVESIHSQTIDYIDTEMARANNPHAIFALLTLREGILRHHVNEDLLKK